LSPRTDVGRDGVSDGEGDADDDDMHVAGLSDVVDNGRRRGWNPTGPAPVPPAFASEEEVVMLFHGTACISALVSESSPSDANDDDDVRLEHSDWCSGDLDVPCELLFTVAALPPLLPVLPPVVAAQKPIVVVDVEDVVQPSTLPAKMSVRLEKADSGLLPATTTRLPEGW